MGTQEAEEFHALAQAALHHLGGPHHLADDGGDLRRAEVEAPVEVLDRGEDLGVVEVRIGQRRDLGAALGEQVLALVVEPAVLPGLLIEERARVGRRQGEILGLQWADVNLETGCLAVTGALQRVEKRLGKLERLLDIGVRPGRNRGGPRFSSRFGADYYDWNRL